MDTPYVTIVLDEVDSTQDVAAAKLESSSLPVLIVASRQGAGRGRSGNDWWQAPRGTAASLAFRNEVLAVDDTFTLVVGLAVREALAAVAGVAAGLKWPNDIEIGEAKVGGVLVERDGSRTVVGCGLNLWWPEPPEGVAGVFSTDPGEELGRELSNRWAGALLSGKVDWDRGLYAAVCSTLGCEVSWDPGGRGIAVDIDANGGLVVETDRGEQTLRSGVVSSIRRAR